MISLILPIANHCVTQFASTRCIDRSTQISGQFSARIAKINDSLQSFLQEREFGRREDPFLLFHRVKAIALGIPFPITYRHELKNFESNISSAQSIFTEKFYQKKPAESYRLIAFNISMLAAQIFICVKNPIKPTLRIISITALIASSIFFANKRAFSNTECRQRINQIITYSHSSLFLQRGTEAFNEFLFRTPQGRLSVLVDADGQAKKRVFTDKEVEALIRTLKIAANCQKTLTDIKDQLLRENPQLIATVLK